MSDNDDWKKFKPMKVPGCEKMEEATEKCVQKAIEAEKECQLCTNAAEKGDLLKAQEHFKKLKGLEAEIKELDKQVKDEAARLKAIHDKWQPDS